MNPTTLVRPYEGKEPSPSGGRPYLGAYLMLTNMDLQGRLSPSRPNA